MDRARRCLKLYFEPDMTAEDRVAILEAFARALRDFPRWAVSRAFDGWEREQRRRPSPGDIVALTRAALQPVRDELAERQKALQPPEPPRVRSEAEKAAANEVLRRAGFTPRRMEVLPRKAEGGAPEQTEAHAPRPTHTFRTLDSVGLEVLRAARNANPLVQAARADAARADGPGE